METETEQDYITLKWGTLKSWNVKSAEGKALLEKYGELGYSMSAMAQHDTPEQKEIICKLIDLMPGEIYLDWNGEYVSKEAAKKYVLEYGLPTPRALDGLYCPHCGEPMSEHLVSERGGACEPARQ